MRKFNRKIIIVVVIVAVILPLFFLFGRDDKLCQKIIKIVTQKALTNLESVIYWSVSKVVFTFHLEDPSFLKAISIYIKPCRMRSTGFILICNGYRWWM